MKRQLLDNLKNIPGWRNEKKFVVLAVDDYGNVHLDSAAARDRMCAAGLDMRHRFDRLDALETKQDLEALFEVLSSVSDSSGSTAVLTPYAVCANPDFDAILDKRDGYHYEPVTSTFDRVSCENPVAYEGTWALWEQGVREGLLKPQFHGREHLNVEILERKLAAGDKTLMVNLKNRSLAALGAEPSMPGVGYTQAFGHWDRAEVPRHQEILESGLELFENVFGFASKTFTPPAQQLHPDLYTFVESSGVNAIDKPFLCIRRLDKHKKKREWNALGIQRGQQHVTIVRNVVFEPTNDPAFDSVKLALSQVAAAFRWRRPAIISSHRVNFVGHIDPENRRQGLAKLKQLLDGIVQRWPDVTFISADRLADMIIGSA